MGRDAIASCECGFTATVPIGGGQLDFLTTFYFPALCKKCNGLVRVNLLEKSMSCPKCRSTGVVPYDQPELIKVEGPNRLEWDDRYLTDGAYFCPGCGQFTLTFKDVGICWD